MLRRLALLFLTLILLGTSTAFAADDITENRVSGDEISLLKMVGSDQSTILVVNIADASAVMENPIRLVVIKTENTLSFADEMGDALQVSVMKLTRDAAEGTLGKNDHITDSESRSEGYTEEAAIINSFFDLKQQLANHVTEYTTLDNLYQFSLYTEGVESPALTLAPETYAAYTHWMALEAEIADLKAQLSEARDAYLRLFEVFISDFEIQTPSPQINLGVLETGNYSIRFLNEKDRLIRAFDLTITDGNIEMIEPKGL